MKKSQNIQIMISLLIITCSLYAQSGLESVQTKSMLAPILPQGKNLRFGGDFSGSNDSFTFGIIADRHGGNPLIGWTYFEQAIRDMNRLHPDFVIMPGDLIDGYIRREGAGGAAADFNEQFDLFAHFADKLEMPLFFVAGNHDLSNIMMKEPFLQRFGGLWYSFDYRDVHFIALCTQAEPGDEGQPHHFTEEQVNWALADIAASAGARHTIVFMHHPAWSRRNRETLLYRQWLRIEERLKGRKYTVIAGHTHDLSMTARNGRPYYVMATSGGSQIKPHSFYLGRTHHIGLMKVERDTVYLTILELGGVHSMDQVSKTQRSPLEIRTTQSLSSKDDTCQAAFRVIVHNPQNNKIYAKICLKGLSPSGWLSIGGEGLTEIIAPGDSMVFHTILSAEDPLASYPPRLSIEATDNGLKLLDLSDAAPLFKESDYRTIPDWYSAAPFDGRPMSYKEPPFDPRECLPAMFKNYGPENNSWQAEEKFDGHIGWKRVTANENGRIELDKNYGDLISPLGYATASLESPDTRMTYLRFAVNDYGRLWLNGKAVGPEIIFWEDGWVTFPVWLQKGNNRLLIKTANWSNKWYFELKIADPQQSLRWR